MAQGDDEDEDDDANDESFRGSFVGEPHHHSATSHAAPKLAMLESFQEKCTQRYLDNVNTINVTPEQVRIVAVHDDITAAMRHTLSQ